MLQFFQVGDVLLKLSFEINVVLFIVFILFFFQFFKFFLGKSVLLLKISMFFGYLLYLVLRLPQLPLEQEDFAAHLGIDLYNLAALLLLLYELGADPVLFHFYLLDEILVGGHGGLSSVNLFLDDVGNIYLLLQKSVLSLAFAVFGLVLAILLYELVELKIFPP